MRNGVRRGVVVGDEESETSASYLRPANPGVRTIADRVLLLRNA